MGLQAKSEIDRYSKQELQNYKLYIKLAKHKYNGQACEATKRVQRMVSQHLRELFNKISDIWHKKTTRK